MIFVDAIGQMSTLCGGGFVASYTRINIFLNTLK
jgi:hypothetical protein